MPSADPLFTIVVPTARRSRGVLVGLGDEHLFGPTFRSLEAQTCRDFEVVVADCLAGRRDLTAELRALGNWTFRWRVVPGAGPWLKRRLWSAQHAQNEAAIHADGRVLIFCGDAGEFPSDALARAKVWLEAGKQPHFLCIYKRANALIPLDGSTDADAHGYGSGDGGKTTLGDLRRAGVFGPGARVVRDSRWQFVEARNAPIAGHWQWFYGYGTVEREAFFAVNGFDENCDGDKALGDVEIGSRLELAGHLDLVLDPALYVYEHDHGLLDADVVRTDLRALRSNYSLVLLNRALRRTRGNSYRLTDDELELVIGHGVAWSVPRYAPEDEEYALQQWWRANPPIFDLRERWAERRRHEQKDA